MTGSEIQFTYSVTWRKVDTLWAHRFDHYIKTGNDKVHHLQFFGSVLIAFVATFGIFRILQATLAKDMNRLMRNSDRLNRFRGARYDAINTTESQDEPQI